MGGGYGSFIAIMAVMVVLKGKRSREFWQHFASGHLGS